MTTRRASESASATTAMPPFFFFSNSAFFRSRRRAHARTHETFRRRAPRFSAIFDTMSTSRQFAAVTELAFEGVKEGRPFSLGWRARVSPLVLMRYSALLLRPIPCSSNALILGIGTVRGPTCRGCVICKEVDNREAGPRKEVVRRNPCSAPLRLQATSSRVRTIGCIINER